MVISSQLPHRPHVVIAAQTGLSAAWCRRLRRDRGQVGIGDKARIESGACSGQDAEYHSKIVRKVSGVGTPRVR